MLDGLRQDFPQIFALVDRIPNPRVARAPLVWALLAAYGAGFFVSSALTIVFWLMFGGGGAFPFQLAGAIAMAVAVAVAWTSGGRETVIVYAAILVVERMLTVPSLSRFCLAVLSESPTCSLGSYVLNLWPVALGGALAYGAIRGNWMRVADGDRNTLLEPAGAIALDEGLLTRVLGLLFASAGTFEGSVLVLAGALAGGAACGLVVLRRVAPARQWLTLGVIAAAVAAQWVFVSMPQYAGQLGIGGAIAVNVQTGVAFLSPLFEIAAAAFVLYFVAARKVTPAA
jgi:hypothetical protein